MNKHAHLSLLPEDTHIKCDIFDLKCYNCSDFAIVVQYGKTL